MIKNVKIVALQAPVSDREAVMLEPKYQENVQYARSLVETGKAEEMMPRNVFWAPITAERFLSLQDIDGQDDFFSSDLTNEQMHDRLSHVGDVGRQIGLKLIAIFSAKDEYVPKHVNVYKLSERLCQAMNGTILKDHDSNHTDGENIIASKLILDSGNHNLSQGENDAEQFVQSLKDKLKLVKDN